MSEPTNEERINEPASLDSKVANLLVALHLADRCRMGDPPGCVCQPCWDAVSDAAEALNPPKTTGVTAG